jgi:hypothetical protein
MEAAFYGTEVSIPVFDRRIKVRAGKKVCVEHAFLLQQTANGSSIHVM